jgi:hypothetical protein
MRVAKKCTECRKLKSRLDFPVDNSHEGYGPICILCLEQKPSLKNKINTNNQIEMATLKEKREAAEAAKKEAAVKTTPAKTTDKPKTDSAKTAADPKPKAGDKTPKGDTVVGEKKEAAQRGRKPYVEKPIELLDKETLKVVATHNTAQEAADSLGCTRAYIIDGLKGWTSNVKGFKIRYKGEEIFVREKKAKSDAEKTFKEGDPKNKKNKKVVAEDVPVPGDLDYDEELHGTQPEAEEDILDEPEADSAE